MNIHFLTKEHSMFDGIIGKITGCTICAIENTPSIARKLKKNVANNLQKHSLFCDVKKSFLHWRKDYPDIAEMCSQDKNLPPEIALLFEEGTKTNQTYMTNNTLLIEVINANKKTFLTLEEKNKQFSTTRRWKKGGDDKITLRCDGEQYDICLPWLPNDSPTLETISGRTRIGSNYPKDLKGLEIISADSTKKKQ